MQIAKRLIQIIASGFALAAKSEAQPWKTPRPPPDHPAKGTAQSPLWPGGPQTAAALPSASLTRRELAVIAAGFALAAVATVSLWIMFESSSSPQPWPWSEEAGTRAGTPDTAVQASGQPATCSMEPIAAAANEKDGLFPLQSSVEGLIAADITSFMVIGNQAAAAGRRRDAEAAYLMSCRVADKLKGAGSVESAEAKYQLGSLYERIAIDSGAAAGASRAELLGRAERLYLDGVQAMTTFFGKTHEKSQRAAQGLESVRQTLAQGANPPSAPATASASSPASAFSPAPASASAAAPVLSPDMEPVTNAASKIPEPVQPQAAPVPPALPTPQADTASRTSPGSPARQKCPEAVATLGLCSPAN